MNLSDNEIIKADEWIIANYENYIKDGCNNIEKELLDLAKRQKAEIDILIRKKESLRDEISDLKAEVERLKKEVEVKSQKRANFFEIIDAHEKGRTRAIKEFAERLKEKFIHKGKSTKYGEFTWDDVTSYELDNLVKEMTERKE